MDTDDSSSSDDDDETLGSLLHKKSLREDKPVVGGGVESNAHRSRGTADNRPSRSRRMFEDSSSDEPLQRPTPLVNGRKRRAPARLSTAGREPPLKRARVTRTSPKSSRRAGGERSTSRNSPSPNKKGKSVSSYPKKQGAVPLVADVNAPKWWETEPYKGDIKWKTLDHNGILFPPPYEPHGVKILYKGKPVDLTPAQEELAGFYAMRLETDWVKKKQYNINFFKEFRKELMNPNGDITHPEITDFKHINFRPIHDWMKRKKEEEKARKKDAAYRQKLKDEKAAVDEIYGWAIVDGVREKVGNYKVEPPGLFQGRGDHPKAGLLKKRLKPSQITLNIGRGFAIPRCPVEGEEWGAIIHDPTVTYIAKWVENINGAHKMVYLHASSRFKGQSDMAKYDKARKLKNHIDRIRKDYEKMLKARDRRSRQLATCVWVIDKLSIRVGNEKDTDEEADTVGVCSFRVEHLHNFTKTADGKYQVTLDFLGKDSMRYLNTVSLPEVIFKNMMSFCQGKSKEDDVFEKVDPQIVNEYLKSMMEGLSAKVFRTHNASVCLEKELKKTTNFQLGDRKTNITVDTLEHEKKYFYDTCNKTVAILCNHKKTVNQERFNESSAKMDEKIDKAAEALKSLRRKYAIAKGSSKPKTKEEQAFINKDPKAIKAQLDKKKAHLQKLKMTKNLKIENKEVALGTSKINYMDPRITVAFCKRVELPIEKVFNKALLDKFPWAMAASPDYAF